MRISTRKGIDSKRPLEDSYNESFNGLLMNELLNGEIFQTLKEAKILIRLYR